MEKIKGAREQREGKKANIQFVKTERGIRNEEVRILAWYVGNGILG
jgi:hypothetical protein